MAKNEAKIKFTAETSGMNAEIKKSNDEMSKLRAELKLNETQMKTTGATVEGLEEKHKILQAQLSASESKTEALRQKVEKAADIFGENSTEVTKLTVQLLNAQTAEEKIRQSIAACNSELEDQRNAVSQAETAMNGAEDAAANLNDSIGDLEGSTDKATDGFTVMKGAMADLVADGIRVVVDGFKEIVTEAFTMANDIEKATNTFVSKTGASAEEAEKFEDVIVSIYNGNYGESFEDIAESASIVQTVLGDMGTEGLERTTTNALVLRDTFDFDVQESVRAVNSMMDQFGITADEAFNLLVQGAQNGLNQNGDLLDVINEYSPQFKNAGYSANDMFNMLANGTAAGTWSVDKLGDAFKEFNIRASDGTVSEAITNNAKAFGLSAAEAKKLAEEVSTGNVGAYQKLAEQLKSVDDDTQRYQLGVSMFGTMWEDLGEEAVLAMLNTKGEISSTNDAMSALNEVKYDDLGSAMEGIGRNLKTSIAEPIQNDVMPKVNEFIQNIDWQGVGDTIGNAFGKAVDGAISLVNAIADATKWMSEHQGVVIAVASVIGVLAAAITAYNVVQGIKSAMEAAEVTTVWGLVAAHWAQATAAMAAMAPYILIVAAIAAVIAIIVVCVKYWDEIVAAVKKCWDAVKATLATWGNWINENVIQPVVNFFKGIWDGIVNVFTSIGDWIKNNWQSILLFIINPFAGIFNYLYENFEGFRNFVDNFVASIKEFFVNLWEGAKEIWSKIVEAIKNAWEKVKNAVSNAINAVKTTVTNIWNGIKTTTTNVWNGIKDGVSNAINAVKNTVSSIFNGIKSTVTSIWNGIKEAISNPIEAAKEKVRSVIDAIKGFFNFKFSWPNIPMPHFSITPKGWKVGDLLEGKIPKLGIDWYAEGGILTKPTIFGINGNRLMAGGEAGAEAILPIDRLEGYISNAIEKSSNNANLLALADSINRLASRPIEMNINGRQFALATAGDGDSVNGLRSSFKSRGLAL